MINKKYIPNDKNEGNVPELPIIGKDEYGRTIYDDRVCYVELPCGNCIECREAKAREWQVRLGEEIKDHKYKYFITLTFSPKELQQLCLKTRLEECNAVAAYAVRHMLERWRKTYKKSLRHWLITELGHEGTERIHMHGILMSDIELQFDKTKEENFYTWKYWKYGLVYVGQYVNQRTVNYIVKYINKIDNDHKGFVGQILCSPGIGKSWLDRIDQSQYKYRPRQTKDTYTLNNGCKVKQPTYYRNKLRTPEEREQIWREFMDLNHTTIAGNTYFDREDGSHYGRIVGKAQEMNKFMGFGDDSREWRKKPWNITKRMLQQEERKRQMDLMAAKIRENNYKIAQKMQKDLEI